MVFQEVILILIKFCKIASVKNFFSITKLLQVPGTRNNALIVPTEFLIASALSEHYDNNKKGCASVEQNSYYISASVLCCYIFFYENRWR